LYLSSFCTKRCSAISLAERGSSEVLRICYAAFLNAIALFEVIFMDEGQILESSNPDQFFDNPQTDRAAYFISKILTQ